MAKNRHKGILSQASGMCTLYFYNYKIYLNQIQHSHLNISLNC